MTVEINSGNLLGTLDPPQVAAAPDQTTVIQRAIEHPIGRDFPRISSDSTVAVVVDDATRVTPTRTLLEVVFRALIQHDAIRDRITVFVANGLHPPGDKAVLTRLLGTEPMQNYKVVNHDGRNRDAITHIGRTIRGTPVEVNTLALNNKIRILIGIIEPHQLAGYSGGVKSMIPGLAGAETITANHSLMLQQEVRVGNLNKNPLRDDLEEATQLTHKSGSNFIVNVILNAESKIVNVVAGDEVQAHREGASISAKASTIRVPESAEIVVASPGGYPRDMNLYQSQKALAHVEGVVNHGGVAILVAECKYGVGSKTCEEWLIQTSSPDDIIRRIRDEGFNMGAHKAYQLARFMTKADVIFVTRIPTKLMHAMHLKTATNLATAYREAVAMVGRDSRVLVIPQAAATLPTIRNET